MLNGNTMFRRLCRTGALVAVAALACAPLRAQSATSPQPAFGSPSTMPAAPVGTTFTPESQNAPARPDTRVSAAPADNYRIGADDVLSINVWHEPEVSRQVAVRPDGKISLPLIGDVQASGLTPAQLQTVLQASFTKFLTSPEVSVIVVQIRSQRFNVLGEVQRPGTYPLIPPISVIDAIANAGGLREFAKANKIYVLRTGPDGQRERIRFHYKDVLKGKRGSQDLLIQNRDTVVVP